MSSRNPQDYSCPLCKGTERVEKISVLYEASTATGNYGADGSMRVFIKTTEYSKFAPPEAPSRPPSRSTFSAWVGFAVLFCMGSGCLVFSISRVITNTPILIASGGQGESTPIPNVIGLLVSILVFLFTLSLAVIAVLGRKRVKNADAKDNEQWAIQLQHWEHAMEVWRRLYYCKLHDIVFLPGKNENYVSASQMRNLIYP